MIPVNEQALIDECEAWLDGMGRIEPVLVDETTIPMTFAPNSYDVKALAAFVQTMMEKYQ